MKQQSNKEEDKKEQIDSSYIRFYCGGVAGIVSRTLTAPIDRVKVLRQMKTPAIEGLNLLNWGIIALWRGNGVNVLKNCPESALRFGLHGKFKNLLFPAPEDGKRHDLTPLQRLLVAGMSGCVSMTCVYPFEVLKTRMTITTSNEPRSISQLARKVYTDGGPLGFYRGYSVAMMSYIPYSSMELALYEIIKRQYMSYFKAYDLDDTSQSNSMPHLNWFESCGLIMFASLPPMTLVYPLNMLRTRFQAKSKKSPSIRQALITILRNEGPLGLYQGFLAQISKTLPAVCIGYATLESLLELFGHPTLATR
ncbi:Exosome component 3 [Cichlidogyrus casuarinus]|uniref:Exosome component 3 n=1 Tax=Cichlidogyrus casuarinus TaxID=1844966 RepID=A0ABD2QEK0_9PLAT